MNRFLRRHGFAILATALVPLSIAGMCRRQPGVKKVPQIRLVQGFDAADLKPPTHEIRPASGAKALPSATPAGEPGYITAYANPSRNSRSTASLPTGAWRVRWRIPLRTELEPVLVLAQGQRVLARAVDWQLADLDGRVLANGPAGGGPVVLDGANDLFYRFLPTAFLAAARMSSGKQAFLYSPAYGEGFSRVFLARNGGRVLVAGIERALDPHGGRQPSRSILEAFDPHEPFETTGLGVLTTVASPGELHIDAVNLALAATNEAVAAAVPDCVFLIGWDMAVRAALTGTFEPVSLSMDEAGRMYLVVRLGERFALWLVEATGKRIYAAELPESVPAPSGPPILAWDHSAYLIAGSQVIAVAPDGKMNWLKTATGHVAGGLATADGQLLLAEGDSITAWDSLGQRRVVHTLAGEELRSAPVLAANGDLVVASRNSVYCLSPVK